MKLLFWLFGMLLLACPACAQVSSVFIEDLTWPEVRDAIAAGKSTAIIYVGSAEQNGPHMVIGKHNFVARALAQYGAQPHAFGGNPTAKNALGVWALVTGILGLFCGISGIAAIILGTMGKQAAARGEATNRTMAQVGFVLGIVGLVFAVLYGISRGMRM